MCEYSIDLTQLFVNSLECTQLQFTSDNDNGIHLLCPLLNQFSLKCYGSKCLIMMPQLYAVAMLFELWLMKVIDVKTFSK